MMQFIGSISEEKKLLDEMSGLENESDVVNAIVINTQYPVEKFTFNWKISNFSKIFNHVYADFSTGAQHMVWRVKMHSKKRIELWQYFDGEPVKVLYEASIITCHNTFRNKGAHKFQGSSNYCKLIEIPSEECDSNGIPQPIKFENDLFHFHCTMIILGHTVTRKTKSPHILNLNTKLCIDFENLLYSQNHCDISICVGQNKIPVHKTILCARSPVFQSMFQFQHEMLEEKNPQIETDDMDFDTLRDFVHFLYTGEVAEFSWDTAIKLYYAADKYEVQDLREVCSQFLQFHLTVDDSCSILKLADRYKDDELKECVMFFIRMHSPEVKLTKGWKDLIKTSPKLAAEVLK